MGFAAGAITFRRYLLSGSHPAALTDEWLAAIAARRFGRAAAGVGGVEAGWIVPTHLLDTDFTDRERILVGRFVYLALRLDRTTPPPALVRSYQCQEEDTLRKTTGRDALSARERKLAREAAHERAESEARKGAFRRMAAYPLAIDLKAGEAYFGCLAGRAAEQLVTLAAETFGVTFVPATADEIGYRAAESLGLSRALEVARPAHLVAPPPGASGEDDGGSPATDRGFLAREFLAWLWFHVMVREGLVRGTRSGEVAVSLHKSMHLECGYGSGGKVGLRCDAPASASEARTALGVGKWPVRAGLMLSAADGAWELTFDALRWTVSGLHVPREDADDAHAVQLDRLDAMARLSALLEDLYGTFLRVRLSESWSREHAAMRRWAQEAGMSALAHRATA